MRGREAIHYQYQRETTLLKGACHSGQTVSTAQVEEFEEVEISSSPDEDRWTGARDVAMPTADFLAQLHIATPHTRLALSKILPALGIEADYSYEHFE